MKRLDFYWFLVKAIFAIVLGFMLDFAFRMGQNVAFFSKDNDFLWTGIIACALSLYLICYALVGEEKTYLLSFWVIGLIIAEIISFFGFFEKVAKDVWYEHNEPTELIPIKPPEIEPNFKKCQEWKYGTFHYGADTITRFKRGKDDYEVINNEYLGKPIKIQWIDECSYYKIRKTGQILSKVNMGDFRDDKYSIHYLYLDQSGYPKTLTVQKVKNIP